MVKSKSKKKKGNCAKIKRCVKNTGNYAICTAAVTGKRKRKRVRKRGK